MKTLTLPITLIIPTKMIVRRVTMKQLDLVQRNHVWLQLVNSLLAIQVIVIRVIDVPSTVLVHLLYLVALVYFVLSIHPLYMT